MAFRRRIQKKKTNKSYDLLNSEDEIDVISYLDCNNYFTLFSFDTMSFNEKIKLGLTKYRSRIRANQTNKNYMVICKKCYDTKKKIVKFKFNQCWYRDLEFQNLTLSKKIIFKGGKTSKDYYLENISERCSKCKEEYAKCNEPFDEYLDRGKRLRRFEIFGKKRINNLKKYDYKTVIQTNKKGKRVRKVVKTLKKDYDEEKEKLEKEKEKMEKDKENKKKIMITLIKNIDLNKVYIMTIKNNYIINKDEINNNIFSYFKKYVYFNYLPGDINKDKIHLNTFKIWVRNILTKIINNENKIIMSSIKNARTNKDKEKYKKYYVEFLKIIMKLNFDDLLKTETYELFNKLKDKEIFKLKGKYLYGIKNLCIAEYPYFGVYQSMYGYGDHHFCESLKLTMQN